MSLNKTSLLAVLFLTTSFALVGCEVTTPVVDPKTVNEQNPVTDPIAEGPTVTPSPAASPVTTTPDPTSVVQMKANINYGGMNSAQMAKAQGAVALMLRVLSSQAFKDRVLNYSHNGMNQFYSTNDSNLQVYNTIIAGVENYNSAPNNTVDINLNLYTPSVFNKWGTVGYTYANSDQIFTNIYYFNSYTQANLAGHWAHEWTHKLGYEHDFNATSQRPYSVPYAIGDLVDELASKL